MKILLQIVSREVAQANGLRRFYTGAPCKHGHDVERAAHNNTCTECERIRSQKYGAANKDKRRAYAAENYEEQSIKRLEWARDNAKKINRQKRELYAKNTQKERDRRKKYYAENRDKVAEYNKRYREINRDYFENYWRENKAEYARRSRQRRAQIKLATPNWLTLAQIEEMKYRVVEAKAISIDTGVLHQVDHIVPLQSKVVCGLHVPWNLRIVTAQENHKKWNDLNQQLAIS